MSENYNVKILLIDDEEDVREIAKLNMEAYGYTRFETLGSIEEAKEKFEHEHFDVLIIDMVFNGKRRGFELSQLGNDENKIASNMIIFTANDDVMDCRKAFKMGVWDYIPKNMPEGNPYEELHLSIQEAVKHTDTWGNDKDSHWVNEHIDELIKQYEGEYVSVMDGEVIANAKTQEELEAIMQKQDAPSLMPLIFKVM